MNGKTAEQEARAALKRWERTNDAMRKVVTELQRDGAQPLEITGYILKVVGLICTMYTDQTGAKSFETWRDSAVTFLGTSMDSVRNGTAEQASVLTVRND